MAPTEMSQLADFSVNVSNFEHDWTLCISEKEKKNVFLKFVV